MDLTLWFQKYVLQDVYSEFLTVKSHSKNVKVQLPLKKGENIYFAS